MFWIVQRGSVGRGIEGYRDEYGKGRGVYLWIDDVEGMEEIFGCYGVDE